MRQRFVGGDVFGDTPFFLKKGSLITRWKVEMLDGLFSVQVKPGYLPCFSESADMCAISIGNHVCVPYSVDANSSLSS